MNVCIFLFAFTVIYIIKKTLRSTVNIYIIKKYTEVNSGSMSFILHCTNLRQSDVRILILVEITMQSVFREDRPPPPLSALPVLLRLDKVFFKLILN